MQPLNFPPRPEASYAIRNVHEVYQEQLTFPQRASDRLAQFIGSWSFIIVQSMLLVIWIILNTIAFINHWDPYPFILMNLVLSTQAAVTGPILMMSQNRQADRDRIESHNDYEINVKAEKEIRTIMEHLEAQDTALVEIHRLLAELQGKMKAGS